MKSFLTHLCSRHRMPQENAANAPRIGPGKKKMKRFFCTALAVLVLASWTSAAEKKPNILVILVDDMGYGELICQGNPQIPTPNIDSIAKNGIRFTNGYVSCPVCSPTRAGLLTGRYQQRFGYELNPGFSPTMGLPLGERTMAEYFKAAGYDTGMFGKWHLGFRPAMHPTKRGFDEYFGFLGGAHSYVDAAENGRGPANPILRGTERVPSIDYTTDAFAREAVTFIDKHRDKPWFVYLPFNAVHGPIQAPQRFTDKFAEIADAQRRAFAGVLAALDEGVGSVLAKLRELNIEENTLIFFFSDNGAPHHAFTQNSNQPLRGYKAQLLEGGIREPFMIQWKGHLPAGKVDDRPIIQLDILPTALAAAGLPMPAVAKLDGVNLLPYLTGAKDGPPHDALFWRYDGQHAVRMGDWKLLHTGRKTQLYNLAQDIGEKNDLAASNSEKLKELETAYKNWDSMNSKRKGGHSKPEPGDTPKTLSENDED